MIPPKKSKQLVDVNSLIDSSPSENLVDVSSLIDAGSEKKNGGDNGLKQSAPITSPLESRSTVSGGSTSIFDNQNADVAGFFNKPNEEVSALQPQPTPQVQPKSVVNPLPFTKKENAPSITTADGTSFVLNNATPFGDSQEAVKGLQERVLNKAVTEQDIDVLSKASGKSIDATKAYLNDGNFGGSLIENNEVVQNTRKQLTDFIQANNEFYGRNDDPNDILSSSEKSYSYLLGKDRQAQKTFLGQDPSTIALPPLMPNISSELLNHVTGKIVEEEPDKNNAIVKIAKVLNPKDFEASAFQNNEKPALSENDAKRQRISELSHIIPDGTFQDELLNSQKGIAEQKYNDSLKQNALNKMSKGYIDKNENLIAEGKNDLAKVEDNVADKYPALQKQEMIRRVSEAIAEESGVVQGRDSENLKEYWLGASQGDIKRHLTDMGYFENPKTKDLAEWVVANPQLVADNSILGSVPASFKQPFLDLGLGVQDIVGFRGKDDINADRVRDQLFPKDFSGNDENDPNSLQLKGIVKGSRTVANTTANLMGMLAISSITEGASNSLLGAGAEGVALTQTANAGKLAFSKQLGAYTSFGLPAFDPSLKDAKNFIDNEPAQYLYAAINSIAMAEGGRILDLGKITRLPISAEFKNIAEGLSNKTLSEDAAKGLLEKGKQKYIDFAVKYGKNVTKGAATMAYFSTSSNILKMAFGDPAMNGGEVIEQAGHAFVDGVLGMSIMGAFGASADMRNEKNTIYKGNIYNMALNHDAAKDVLTLGLKKGNYTQEQYNEKVRILNTAVAAKDFLDIAESETNQNLTQNQKSVFVANETAEKVLRQQAKEAVLPETKSKYEAQADKLKEQSNQVLDGLKFTSTLEPLTDLYNAEKEYNVALENFNPADAKSDSALQSAKEKYDALYSNYLKDIPDTKLSQPIVGVDAQGIPVGENVPAPTDAKVERAIININGKTYEGKNHAEAILNAQSAGEDISQVDRSGQGQFKLSDGTIINRQEAKSRFGQDRAELLIPQDEASKQANIDYGKVTNETSQTKNEVPVTAEKAGTTNEAVDNSIKQAEAGTNEEALISQAKDLVNADAVKGYSAEILKDAAKNNTEDFKSHLSDIAQQAQDADSQSRTVKTYGQPLVDIATKLFPKEEVKPTTQEQGVSNSIIDKRGEKPSGYFIDNFRLNEDGTATRSYESVSNAKPIDRYKGLDLFSHKDDNGNFIISDTKSGAKITEGKTLKEANDNLGSIVNKNGGEEGFSKAINDKIKTQEQGVGNSVVEGSSINPRDFIANHKAISEITEQIFSERAIKSDGANKADDVINKPIRDRLNEIDKEISKMRSDNGVNSDVDLMRKVANENVSDFRKLVGLQVERDNIQKEIKQDNFKAYNKETERLIAEKTKPYQDAINREEDRIDTGVANISKELGATRNDLRWGNKPIDEELGDRIGDGKSAIFVKPHETEIETANGVENINDGLQVELVTVNPKNRNEGLAKKRLQEITQAADKHQIPLFIDIVPQEKGVTKEGLRKLYDQYGFKFDGVSGKREPNIKEVKQATTESESNTGTTKPVSTTIPAAKEKSKGQEDKGSVRPSPKPIGQPNAEVAPAVLKEGKYAAKAKKIADDIRKADLPQWLVNTDPTIKQSGVSADSLKNAFADAVEHAGKLLDKGVEIKDALKEAADKIIDHILTDYPKGAKLKSERESQLRDGFEKYYKENILAGEEIKSDAGKGNKPPTEEVKVAEGEGNNGREQLKEMASNIPNEGELREYASKGTIEKYHGETPENEQGVIVQELTPALTHGENIINKAKEVFGENNYVENTLQFIEDAKIPTQSKALMYISLENDLARQKLANPNSVDIQKKQNLVRAESQAFLREASLAINFGKLRKIGEVGYDISKVTDRFFSAKEREDKVKVEKSIEANADEINKEAESQEINQEQLDQKIKDAVDVEINNIYEKLPTERRKKADKAIAALEKIQKKIRANTYEGTIGVPLAIIDSGITVIKNAIKAGVNIADAIELGIQRIKEKHGKDWAKESDFRKDMIAGFKDEGIKREAEGTAKRIVKDALIEAGFGRDILVKTKDGKEIRTVLDWKTLAGQEGSIERMKENVNQVLEKRGLDKDEISEIQKSLADEYNNIRASVIEKSINELNRRNQKTLTADQKSAAKKLSELYNYGLFEKDPAQYDILLAKAIGIDRLNPERFKEAHELGKALEILYSSNFNGKKLNDLELKTAIQSVEEKMRIILHNEAGQHGSSALKLADIVRTYMDATQRMILNSLGQGVQNPLAGLQQVVMSNADSFLNNSGATKELRDQKRKAAASVYKDMVTAGGVNFGDVNTTFVSRGNLDAYIAKMSDNKLFHSIASTFIGKTTLDAADSFFKSKLTDQKFIHNLIKVLITPRLVDGRRVEPMSKPEAINYVSEKLTGQSFDNAKKTAKEIIDKVNEGGKKIVGDSDVFVTRLANDIVKAALVNGKVITSYQVTAAYNAAYKSAGRSMGHEANNPLSAGVQSVSAKIEKSINDAIKDKEYKKAALLTYQSIFFRNILNPFVGGGTNWIVLKLEKNGLGLVSGLYNGGRTKLDMTTYSGLKQVEKSLYEEARDRDAFMRGAIGGATSLLMSMLWFGVSNTDDYRKWRNNNKWAAKYLDYVTPEEVLATMAVKNKELGYYVGTLINKNMAYDKAAKVITGVDYAAKGKSEKAAGKLGEAFGANFGVPIPWRLVRDFQNIWLGAKGEQPYKINNKPSKTFWEGALKAGMVDYIKNNPLNGNVSGGNSRVGSGGGGASSSNY